MRFDDKHKNASQHHKIMTHLCEYLMSIIEVGCEVV